MFASAIETERQKGQYTPLLHTKSECVDGRRSTVQRKMNCTVLYCTVSWEEEVQCPAEDVSKFVCSSDRIIKVSRPINIIFKLLAQHFAPRRQAIDISPVCLAPVHKINSWVKMKQDF